LSSWKSPSAMIVMTTMGITISLGT